MFLCAHAYRVTRICCVRIRSARRCIGNCGPGHELRTETERPASLQALCILAPRPGFEPGTCGLTGRYVFGLTMRVCGVFSVRKVVVFELFNPLLINASNFIADWNPLLCRGDFLATPGPDIVLGHLHAVVAELHLRLAHAA